MKKKICFLFLVLFIVPISVFATPTSYSRTMEDLLVPRDVVVDNQNIEEIMSTPAVDGSAKIYDFADLLTDAEETKVYMSLNEFIKNTELDSIIITTNDLGGFSISEYTYHFYDYNDFKNEGVAFVIYKNGEKTSIFMGNNGPKSSDVFNVYTDSTIQGILKHVYDNHVRSGDYFGACETYVKLIDGFYLKYFGSYKVRNDEQNVGEYPWVEVFIISIVISFIIISLMVTKYRNPVKRVDQTIKNGLNTNTMVVKCEYDNLILEKKDSKV